MEINIGIIAIVVLAIAILAILASGYVKASPNNYNELLKKMTLQRTSVMVKQDHYRCFFVHIKISNLILIAWK